MNWELNLSWIDIGTIMFSILTMVIVLNIAWIILDENE